MLSFKPYIYRLEMALLVVVSLVFMGTNSSGQEINEKKTPVTSESDSSKVSSKLESSEETEVNNSLFDLSLEDLLDMDIQTASRRVQKASDAPAMVYIITEKEIRERGYANLKDIFHDLPGLGVHENFFCESGTLVAARGIAGNNKIIVLVNGIRLNPPGNEHLPLRSDMSVRFAKQVEIIYGPGSTMYGNDAISMVVNIITHMPQKNWKVDGQFLGGFGNAASDPGKHIEGFFGFTKRFNEVPAFGSLGASGFVQVQEADLDDYKETFPKWYKQYEDRDGGITPSVYNGAKRRDFGINAFFKLESENSSFTIWHRDSERNSGDGGLTPVLQMIPEAVWHDRSTVMEAKSHVSPVDGLVFETALTGSRYEVDHQSRYVFNPSPGAQIFLQDWKYGVGYGVNLEENITLNLINDLMLTGGFVFYTKFILPKATVNRSDEVGFNANSEGADPSIEILDQGQSFVWYEMDSTKKMVSNYTLYEYQNYAGYLEGQWDIFDTNLKLVCGIRVDKDSRYDDVPLSPRAAIIYNPIKSLAIKALYTQAFVNPAPYFNFAAFNGTNFDVPNPNLKPEIARTVELNTTYTMSKLLTGISVYYNMQDKLLVHADEGQPFQLLNDINGKIAPPVWQDEAMTIPAGISQSVNSGKGRTIGLDLYSKVNLSFVSIWGSYSHINHEVTISGKTHGLDALANNHIRFGTTFHFLEGKLNTTLAGEWRSTLKRLDGNHQLLDGKVKNPYVINAIINYKPLEWFGVFLYGKNITNHQYALKGVFGPTPQEMLKILGGIKLSF